MSCTHPECHLIDEGDETQGYRCDDCGDLLTQQPPHGWCKEHGRAVPVVEEFDDQIGYEEKARPVRVMVLACGHEVVRPRKESAS